jgi:hypothetical protein
MGYEQEQRGGGAGGDPAAASGGKAPGKRALTDRLAQRAAQKNPTQQARLGFKREAFSSAPVDSEAFAHDVADKQASHGLKVDGVAGRKTVKAVTGQNEFDYLDTGPKKGDGKGEKGGKGGGRRAPVGKAKTTQLWGEFTHDDANNAGVLVVANLGTADGITPETTFQVADASGHAIADIDLTLIRVHSGSTELRSSRPRTVYPRGATVLATIPAPPELDLHGDGSIGDDHDDRLEA